MEYAAKSVRTGELSLRATSAAFGVPKSTLGRHKNKKLLSPGCLGRFRPVLDTQFETELADYCKEMQNRLFGLTISDLRKMVYQLAEKNNVEHNFDAERKMAGREIGYSFFFVVIQSCHSEHRSRLVLDERLASTVFRLDT